MERNRYIRHTLLDQIGENGQKKLSAAHIVLIGCGGLGSIAAPYLAGAGVGKITLVDADKPHVSNLHRQVFFDVSSMTQTKSQALADHIKILNPTIEVIVKEQMASKKNIEEIIKGATVVLECTDNIQTKYLVNDYCHIHNIPLVYGAIYKYDGYVSLFANVGKESIHLRDIFGTPNEDIPTCSEVGVMGTLAGLIGLMQANEAIKYITDAGQVLIDQLLTYNILDNTQMKLKLKKSYKNDISAIYQVSSYQSKSTCDITEITLEELQSERSKYDLISILEDYEHKDIDNNVKHVPLSTIHPEELVEDLEGPTVFYCMTGKRSIGLVRMIREIDSSVEVYSLKNGLKKL